MADDVRLLDYAIGGVVSIVGWLGGTTLSRVRRLELDRQTTSQAAAERSELKQDIRALSDRMDNQHGQLRERLDTIMDRLPGPSR